MWLLLITAVLLLAQPSLGQYDYCEVLHKSILFYEVQRSGWLPDDNRIYWRDHSATDDVGNNGEDLEGGWYDAGDHVKFGFPLAGSLTLLTWSVIEFEDGYASCGELDWARDSIRWVFDYLIKCHVSTDEFYAQVGDGYEDHAYWGRPEDMTMARPAWSIASWKAGSDVAGETAAAFAAGYLAFSSSDPGYASTLLQHAREMYDMAYNNRGFYTDHVPAHDFYGSTNYNDELGWGAIWLYAATGEQTYMDRALEFYSSGVPWALSWDDKYAGLQMMMYIQTNDAQYAGDVQNFLNSWYPGGSVTYTPQGLAWRDMWGPLRYSANTCLVALIAQKYGITGGDPVSWARGQIHYMLGDTGRSYVGGYGNNPPQRAHHRASSCPTDHSQPCDWSHHDSPDPNPGILDGALVGGPDQNDYYEDDRTDYVSNEVANDYNAGFQGAMAGLLWHGRQ